MSPDELQKINLTIADRSNVFYWQTDRDLTPQQAGQIWADRHRYFTDEELTDKISNHLKDDSIEEIIAFNEDSQTNLGNVNSVRVAKLKSGKEVVIRAHPKGINNGYFNVEALASSLAKNIGVPSYETVAVHNFEGNEDFAYHITEKLPGTALIKWLEQHPEDEDRLLIEVGRTMANIHQIKVDGFGPFDNEKAKNGILVGFHETFSDSISAGLDFNLSVLTEEGIFTDNQVIAIKNLFDPKNPLLQRESSVLVHNDFADWNLLTDGKEITGVLDWDECVGGDPILDLACWSTFFDPTRLDKMLAGYFEGKEKPDDFDRKFQLLRLRFTISKMTLRIRRFNWEPTEQIKEKIEIGKKHLEASLKYFGI